MTVVDSRLLLHVLTDPSVLAAALRDGEAAVLLERYAAPAPPGAVAEQRFAAARPHTRFCSCCAGRGAVATALDRLFQDRARGITPWFARVLALAESPALAAEIRAAVETDVLTAARFRLAI